MTWARRCVSLLLEAEAPSAPSVAALSRSKTLVPSRRRLRSPAAPYCTGCLGSESAAASEIKEKEKQVMQWAPAPAQVSVRRLSIAACGSAFQRGWIIPSVAEAIGLQGGLVSCARGIQIAAGDPDADASTDSARERMAMAMSMRPRRVRRSNVGALDIRVGLVVSARAHPGSAELAVTEVDVGEGASRTIVGRFARFLRPEEVERRRVVVLCNTKTRKMLGVETTGQILCAINPSLQTFQLLNPPVEASIGERVFFGSQEWQTPPEKSSTVDRWKLWAGMQPFMKTGPDGVVTYKGCPMNTRSGPVEAPKAPQGNVTVVVWKDLNPGAVATEPGALKDHGSEPKTRVASEAQT
eukprot:evm.model.scf_2371.2 EVM.evm.TU.scf_2371.2   scf_2371:15181-18544(+)